MTVRVIDGVGQDVAFDLRYGIAVGEVGVEVLQGHGAAEGDVALPQLINAQPQVPASEVDLLTVAHRLCPPADGAGDDPGGDLIELAVLPLRGASQHVERFGGGAALAGDEDALGAL